MRFNSTPRVHKQHMRTMLAAGGGGSVDTWGIISNPVQMSIVGQVNGLPSKSTACMCREMDIGASLP